MGKDRRIAPKDSRSALYAAALEVQERFGVVLGTQDAENTQGVVSGNSRFFGKPFALVRVLLLLEVSDLEPTLMVIGLNHHTAPLAMRERFWISETRRYEVLRQLKSEEGIEEVAVLCTSYRTEFLLWASEPTLAANSLLHFLSSDHGLKLSEWQHFYRLLDERALAHVFRVTSGLDSPVLGEPQIVTLVKAAWDQARAVDAAGRFMNAVLEKALSVSKRVREETAIGQLGISIPTAALDLARQVFGTLEGRKVLLLGAGKMSEISARRIADGGAGSVVVIDQSPARSRELAEKLAGTAATLADRWKYMLCSDIVIACTGCPYAVLTREEAERIATERNRVPLVIVDIGMPRDVDPDVRRVDGILLYDLDSLERAVKGNAAERSAATAGAEKIVAAEVQVFRRQLQAESVVPTIVALRRRLDELCRQELESFIEEHGPFTPEQDQSLRAITAQVIQKIASSLARELKEFPEKEEQDRMTAAVSRLFHLESPQKALAGAIFEKKKSEPSKDQTVAINY
jgi:glutamyl-tRNA reductase